MPCGVRNIFENPEVSLDLPVDALYEDLDFLYSSSSLRWEAMHPSITCTMPRLLFILTAISGSGRYTAIIPSGKGTYCKAEDRAASQASGEI